MASTIGGWLGRRFDEILARGREAPLATSLGPGEVLEELEQRFPFREPRPLEEVLEQVSDLLWRGSDHASNPRHFGLFRPGIHVPGAAGEALAAIFDLNLATWRFSPAAFAIERHVLTFVGRAFGFDSGAASCFTSGGQEANHMAVIVALAQTFPRLPREGLRSLPGQPVFYASTEAHHSLDKVAGMTGLGRDALRRVPVDADLQLDVAALDAELARDRAVGRLPFLVVGTAGTTGAGVVDPLHELGRLARERGLRYHVDAAWGGAAVLSPRLRPALAGIETADSVTCDAHKWLSVPVGAGMYFSRNPAAVGAAFEARPPYVPPPPPGEPADPYGATMAWSRRFQGLKLFATLATLGEVGVAHRLEHQAEMANALRALLAERGFQIVNRTALPLVCFTHPELADFAAHSLVMKRLRARQTAWITALPLPDGRPCLRACITHADTQVADLVALVDGVEEALASA